MAGCGRCGTPRRTITVSGKQQVSTSGLQSVDNTEQKLLIEYTGTPTQRRSVRSKNHRGVTYYYGGAQGSSDRLFLVYKSDADDFIMHRDFRIAKVDQAASVAIEEPQTIQADYTPPLESFTPLSALDLDAATITILEPHFQSVEHLKRIYALSPSTILSIKGIGDTRLKEIAHAIESFYA